jgi:hypothetical protein
VPAQDRARRAWWIARSAPSAAAVP